MPILGLDLGGTKVAFAAALSDGKVLRQRVRPTRSSGRSDADLAALVGDARALWRDATTDAVPEAIGLSVPGPIDAEKGLLLDPPNLPGWDRVPIVEAFEEAFRCPVVLENDANAAALSEWRFGAGRGSAHMLYLTMSTGIGGGLILAGRLHRGARGGAGEVGHVPIQRAGRLCACGLRGCLEAYCGGLAWQGRLREETPLDSEVFRLAGSDRESIRPEHLVAAAKAGDAYARAAFSEWLDDLAQGLAGLIMTLQPERIVLGTIAVAAGEALCFGPLRARVAERVWPDFGKSVEILPAALGADLAFRAGLAPALEWLREQDHAHDIQDLRPEATAKAP